VVGNVINQATLLTAIGLFRILRRAARLDRMSLGNMRISSLSWGNRVLSLWASKQCSHQLTFAGQPQFNNKTAVKSLKKNYSFLMEWVDCLGSTLKRLFEPVFILKFGKWADVLLSRLPTMFHIHCMQTIGTTWVIQRWKDALYEITSMCLCADFIVSIVLIYLFR